jgi:hypothetical protein
MLLLLLLLQSSCKSSLTLPTTTTQSNKFISIYYNSPTQHSPTPIQTTTEFHYSHWQCAMQWLKSRACVWFTNPTPPLLLVCGSLSLSPVVTLSLIFHHLRASVHICCRRVSVSPSGAVIRLDRSIYRSLARLLALVGLFGSHSCVLLLHRRGSRSIGLASCVSIALHTSLARSLSLCYFSHHYHRVRWVSCVTTPNLSKWLCSCCCSQVTSAFVVLERCRKYSIRLDCSCSGLIQPQPQLFLALESSSSSSSS